jgi:CubicO group peptidase (beta-lactamase class C family)
MQAPIVRAYGRVSSSSTSAKVTPDTTFMLASVSKVFTAAAVLLLIEDGLIGGLNSDICDVTQFLKLEARNEFLSICTFLRTELT